MLWVSITFTVNRMCYFQAHNRGEKKSTMHFLSQKFWPNTDTDMLAIIPQGKTCQSFPVMPMVLKQTHWAVRPSPSNPSFRVQRSGRNPSCFVELETAKYDGICFSQICWSWWSHNQKYFILNYLLHSQEFLIMHASCPYSNTYQ